VALKILPPQLTQSATHAKLLIEEATQARKLAHENIVRVYEWAQDPATSSYFIIMEYLEGRIWMPIWPSRARWRWTR
jgi:serine/threonine protein kinase